MVLNGLVFGVGAFAGHAEAEDARVLGIVLEKRTDRVVRRHFGDVHFGRPHPLFVNARAVGVFGDIALGGTQALDKICLPVAAEKFLSEGAVSYTHLDVYKRQALARAKNLGATAMAQDFSWRRA